MVISNEILIPQVASMVKKGHTVTLPLRGYSMRPYLEDNRDKAQLSSVPHELRIGDVILAEISPKRYALHRIVAIDDDVITMYGDGNFSPEYVEYKDVVAIAIGFYRKGSIKLSSCDGVWYNIYWRLWVQLRPVRRYLLFLWKLWHYPKQTLGLVIKKIKGK